MLIYCIENTINNKHYIGQTTVLLNRRKAQHKHRLNKNIHNNNYLQNSWNKYGEDNFRFFVLEDGFENINELNKAERFWIDYLQTLNDESGYNLKTGGNNSKHSEETRLKISIANKGKEIPLEMREYLSEACSGWTHTEEAKRKISKKGSKHPRSIFTENDILEIREKYVTGKYTQHELAKEYNCSNYSISNIVLGKSWKHVGGPIVKSRQFKNSGDFKKGRAVPIEEREKKSKLTRIDIIDIRNAHKLDCFTHRELANAWGVSQSCITNIVNYNTWKIV